MMKSQIAKSTALMVAILSTNAIGATSNFDNGSQGWRIDSAADGTIDFPGSGGNPGGFMRFVDGPQVPPPEYAVAPNAYLGDWSQALDNPDIVLSFDAILIDSPVEQGDEDQIIVTLEGPGGSARIDLGLPDSVGEWQPFSAPILESEWTTINGEWSTLLSEVTSLKIQMDWVNPNPMKTGIDNVSLNIVPEPQGIACTLLAIAFCGSRFRRLVCARTKP